MTKIHKKIGFLMPFGFVITFIIVVFVASTSMAIHLPWYFLSKKNSLELVSKINNEISLNMSSYVGTIFNGNANTLNSINELIAKGVIDINNKDEAREFFLSTLATNPEVSWISYGWANGTFIGAQRVSKDIIKFHNRAYNDATKISNNTIFHYKNDGNKYTFIKKEISTSKYNATKRSWYKIAMKNDGSSWTPVYVFSTSKKPGINVAMKSNILKDNKEQFQGVSSIAIELDRLSQYIKGITIGKTGSIFIMDNKEQLIASKDFSKILKNSFQKGVKKKLFNIKNAKDNNAMRIIHTIIKENNIDLNAMKGLKEYFYIDSVIDNTHITLSKVPNTNLIIAIVVPESDFLGDIQKNTEMLFVLILLIIAISIIVATMLIKFIISKPIASLIETVDHIKSFDLDKVSYTESKVREIRRLSNSMEMMKISLASFKKYIPINIVKDLLSNNIEAKIGGEEKVVSIFFSDIENFTNISEQLGVELFPHLEEYFSSMSDEIKYTQGTIDKYIGDCIMAFWNAPADNKNHPKDVCLSAINCQKKLKELRITWAKDDKPLLRTRMGINTGLVKVGNIGSEYKMDYTILGDPVNLASRLEAINKVYKTEIIISGNTYELVKDDFITRKLDVVAVKGKKEGIAIYELLDVKEATIDMGWISIYEKGLSLMHNEELEKAIEEFKKVDNLKGEKDFPSQVMQERCNNFIKNGNFNKVLNMETK